MRKTQSIVKLIVVLSVLISPIALAGDKQFSDPTKPPAYAKPQKGKKAVTHFKLTEIRITEDNRQVVINGRRLKKGQSIGKYRVKKIDVGYVILANSQASIRLNLIRNPIIRKKL